MLDVLKKHLEAEGWIDLNPVQALLLFNIGENEMTAGELKSRGYYQGSNVSYNLKKLVEMGYMSHERSDYDRRAVRISLTEKGVEVKQVLRGTAAATGANAGAISAKKTSIAADECSTRPMKRLRANRGPS